MTCTEQQIRLLMKHLHNHTQKVAAAKSGMSLSTAKRYLKAGGRRKRLDKEPEPRTWRTRIDPFADVWSEVKALLERDFGLEAHTLMAWLIARYPDRFSQGQIRTLRRRIKDWRVLEGPERHEVMFKQTLSAGRQSQSDYTHCTKLNITINGEAFPHMLYHFILPYSRWEFVWICFTESFDTLTLGYRKAVSELGAVAGEHRTDNLAAAVPIGQRHVFQKRWHDFLSHYGVRPSANNAGKSHENGSIEKSHHLFKRALDQRLRLRGHRDFNSIEEYEKYLREMVSERNRQRKEILQEELKVLQALPAMHWNEPKEQLVTVTGWSTVAIDSAVYSAPSRFIGQRMRALLYFDRIELFYGKHCVLEVERVNPGEKQINYRHLIFHLLRKPGAFRGYQFREELFPRLIYRRAYDLLRESNDRLADKEYLQILNEAALGSESEVADALQLLIDRHALPTSEAVKQICRKVMTVPEVSVAQPSLQAYDKLLNHA
jgi:hypothetical protein